MNKIRRIMAMLTVIVIIALIIGTVIFAVTGSENFFGMLALSFLVPIILWIFNWFTQLTNNGDSSKMPGEMDLMDEDE